MGYIIHGTIHPGDELSTGDYVNGTNHTNDELSQNKHSGTDRSGTHCHGIISLLFSLHFLFPLHPQLPQPRSTHLPPLSNICTYHFLLLIQYIQGPILRILRYIIT